jgi:hypothetical protein
MFLLERNTESRGRKLPRFASALRTRIVRRASGVIFVAIYTTNYFFLPSLRKMYSPVYLTPLPL